MMGRLEQKCKTSEIHCENRASDVPEREREGGTKSKEAEEVERERDCGTRGLEMEGKGWEGDRKGAATRRE